VNFSPSPWDVPRDTSAARLAVEVGQRLGMEVSAYLRGTSISLDDLNREGAEIDAADELALVSNLVAALGDRPGLGSEVGRHFKVGNTGMLGYAMLASRTVRAALEVALRYVVLTPSLLRYALEEDCDQARLLMDDEEIPEPLRDFILERDLAAYLSILPIVGSPLAAGHLEVRLDRERGRTIAELASLRVAFDQPRTALVFPRALLDEPMPHADAHTARTCERQCEELLQRRRLRRPFVERVRHRMLRDPARLPSLDALADELHMDESTVRRRLASEGTSFRKLRDQVRETISLTLLEDGLNVEEVAQRLGYAESASFSHAFKRWRGVAPSAHRRGDTARTRDE